MVAWSCLGAARVSAAPCRSLVMNTQLRTAPRAGFTLIQVRTNKSRGGVFHIQASTFHWNKMKDIISLYSVIGLIPVLSIVFYAYVFIGPATLRPIPEGYTPKHWEYYSNPITRFISRYITANPQKIYEKMCYSLFYWQERKILRDIETKAKRLMAKHKDYQVWYYRPAEVANVKKYSKDYQKRLETGVMHGEFPFKY